MRGRHRRVQRHGDNGERDRSERSEGVDAGREEAPSPRPLLEGYSHQAHKTQCMHARVRTEAAERGPDKRARLERRGVDMERRAGRKRTEPSGSGAGGDPLPR